MRRANRRWIAGLMLAFQMLTLVPPAHAFLPLLFGAGRIGAFIGAALPWGMRAGGYAARDPRMLSTVVAVGRGLAGRMSSLGHSIQALPWAKTAVYAGLGTVGGVGGAYGLVEGLSWVLTDNRDVIRVEQAGADSSALPLVNSFSSRKEFVEAHGQGSYWVNVATGSSAPPKVTRVQVFILPCDNPIGTCSIAGSGFPYSETKVDGTMTGPYVTGGDSWVRIAEFAYISDPSNRRKRQLWEFQPASGYVDQGPPEVVEKPIDDAIEQLMRLPDEKLDQPLSDVWLAGLANSAHKAATDELKGEPGYWPWAPSQPLVRPSDVSKVFAENPGLSRPTIRDLTEAIAPPAATVVPLPMPEQYLPTDGTTTPPVVIPGNPDGAQVDWGPDPNVGAPPLEKIPTAQMILEPILNIYPELKNASFSGSVGVCPIGEISLFDTAYVMDHHCVLMEENRALIQLAMILSWSITALFIVLRA